MISCRIGTSFNFKVMLKQERGDLKQFGVTMSRAVNCHYLDDHSRSTNSANYGGNEMNKQEVIEKLRQESFPAVRISNSGSHGYEGLNLGKAIDIIEQLDEPQKVKVKPFVAEWFEENKHNLNFAIFELCEAGKAPVDLSEGLTDFEKWFYLNQDIETLVRMVDGYKVEPPKWIVKKKNGDYVEGYANATTSFTIYIDSHLDSTTPHKFTELAKAEAVAYLVEGTVEKV